MVSMRDSLMKSLGNYCSFSRGGLVVSLQYQHYQTSLAVLKNALGKRKREVQELSVIRRPMNRSVRSQTAAGEKSYTINKKKMCCLRLLYFIVGVIVLFWQQRDPLNQRQNTSAIAGMEVGCKEAW